MKKVEEEKEDNNVNSEISNVNELMSVTKTFNSSQYVRDITTAVKLGEVNPLAAMAVIKRFEKIAKKCLEDQEFKDLATNEAEKHLAGNAKSFQMYSATICKGATYTTFDFSGCGHPILDELYKIEEKVKVEIKRYEDELKLLVTDNVKVDDLGIASDSKEIVVDRIPVFNYIANEDQVMVKAPIKYQKMGIKFMNV